MPGNETKKIRAASAGSEVSAIKGTSGTINRGQLVYITGYDATNELLEVELAKADSLSTMPSIGFSDDVITDTQKGSIIIKGLIHELDTSGCNLRDELYVSPTTAGAFTITKPTGSDKVEKIGEIARVHATLGIIEVYGGGIAVDSSHDINGYTEKASPVSSDIVIIEDSAASYAKKKVQLVNLPGGGGSTSLATAQVRAASGSQTLSGSYVDITFGTVDVESDSSVVSTSGGAVTVYEDGYYELTYTIPTDVGSSSSVQYKIIKNGSTDVVGSVTGQIHGVNCGADFTHEITVTCRVNLSATDSVKVQGWKSSGTNAVCALAGRIFTVTRLSKATESSAVYTDSVTSWTLSGDYYYADVTHNFGTKDVSVQVYTISDGKTVGLQDVERTDTNTVRIWVDTQENVRVLVTANGSGVSYAKRLYYADQLLSPNNSDWAVNALAPAASDPTNAALTVRRFDDTTEEGVGLIVEVPANADSIKIEPRGRAITAPGAARTVGLKWYSRGIPDNAAVESWDSGTQLNDVDITTNAYFQYDSQTISLSTLGLTAGRTYQFELTRVSPSGGTNLTGDWALLELGIEFL